MHLGLGWFEVLSFVDGSGVDGGGLMHMLGSGAGAAQRTVAGFMGDVVDGDIVVLMPRLGSGAGVVHVLLSVSVSESDCIEYVGVFVVGVVGLVVCNMAAVDSVVVGVWVVGFVVVCMEGGCGICCRCVRLNRWRHCLCNLALRVGVFGGA